MVKIGFKLLKMRILFDTHNNGPLFARKQKICNYKDNGNLSQTIHRKSHVILIYTQ